jgi:hypothetical protein
VTNRTGATPKQQTSTPSFNNPAFNNPAFNDPAFNDPAFNNPASNNPISPPRRRRPGKADRRGRRLKSAGAKPVGRQLRLLPHRADPHRADPHHAGPHDAAADPAGALQCDLAFQQAMRWAIARGLERAPIGIVKDHRPLNASRLFEPVPHASGCTSPASECADLVARSD